MNVAARVYVPELTASVGQMSAAMNAPVTPDIISVHLTASVSFDYIRPHFVTLNCGIFLFF